jgi:hypothetical protein
MCCRTRLKTSSCRLKQRLLSKITGDKIAGVTTIYECVGALRLSLVTRWISGDLFVGQARPPPMFLSVSRRQCLECSVF